MTDTKWEFDSSEQTPGYCIWKYTFEDNSWRDRHYDDRTVYFRCNPQGWISTDHKPPAKDTYLVLSNGHPRVSWFGGDNWHITFSPELWKPIILPEEPEPKERFKFVRYIQRMGRGFVVDRSKESPIIRDLDEDQADDLIKYLNKELQLPETLSSDEDFDPKQRFEFIDGRFGIGIYDNKTDYCLSGEFDKETLLEIVHFLNNTNKEDCPCS